MLSENLQKKNQTQNQIRKPTQISWGLSQLKKLKDQNVIIIRALSHEWVQQLFVAAPQMGRRLWFEVVSFATVSPSLNSPFFELKNTQFASYYSIDYYEVDSFVTFADYESLLDFVAAELEYQNYLVFKHRCDSISFDVEFSPGVGGNIAKQVMVDSFSNQEGYALLDETPTSLIVDAMSLSFRKNNE